MFEVSRARVAVALTIAGLASSAGGVAGLTVGVSPALAKSKCKSLSKHHYKTPHKDLDKDSCDKHGTDDGDGATV